MWKNSAAQLFRYIFPNIILKEIAQLFSFSFLNSKEQGYQFLKSTSVAPTPTNILD